MAFKYLGFGGQTICWRCWQSVTTRPHPSTRWMPPADYPYLSHCARSLYYHIPTSNVPYLTRNPLSTVMAAMRLYLEYLEIANLSRPSRRCTVLQPGPSCGPPGRPLQGLDLRRFGPLGNPCVPGVSSPPHQRILSSQRCLPHMLRDEDSGYSDSPGSPVLPKVNEAGKLYLFATPEIDDDTPEVRDHTDSLWLCGLGEDTNSDQRHVHKQEPPNYKGFITPCHASSNSQPYFLPRTPKASILHSTPSTNTNANPAGHPRKTPSKASSKRKDCQGELNSVKTRKNASIKGKQSEALLDKTALAKEEHIQDPAQTNILHSEYVVREPGTSLHSQYDPDSNVQDTAEIGVLRWVDATKDASSFSCFTPPAIPRASTSNRSSPAAPVQALSLRESPVSSSRALVLEFWGILQNRDQDYDACESSQADESIEWFTDDIRSLRTSTNGSGSNDSPTSSATSNSTPIGLISKNALPTNKRSREREREGDEDERPDRRPTREQGVSVPDALQDSSYPGQMSCPMLELHDCQGTNTTISELMRSLMNRHRIVICKECCTRLPIPDEEKRPVNVLQKHASDGCERYCIGTSCANDAEHSTSFHRRTERCPSWATLTKEARWAFIWILVNPESNLPEPSFLPGPAFEHSQIRRPCKQQARARGNEICAQLMRDIETKERRISTLENDLTTAKSENVQVQQRRNEKIVNLDNIIESLLERLCENGIGLSGSLRKRVQNECPEVMAGILAKELQTVPMLPTSTLTPNHGHYSGSGMPLTWGNMTCPPSKMPTIPVTWSAVPQQMFGPNPGYYFPEFSEKAPTTSAMYPTNAYIPDWNFASMSPSTMHAQVRRHSSSETPETVQPCE